MLHVFHLSDLNGPTFSFLATNSFCNHAVS